MAGAADEGMIADAVEVRMGEPVAAAQWMSEVADAATVRRRMGFQPICPCCTEPVRLQCETVYCGSRCRTGKCGHRG